MPRSKSAEPDGDRVGRFKSRISGIFSKKSTTSPANSLLVPSQPDGDASGESESHTDNQQQINLEIQQNAADQTDQLNQDNQDNQDNQADPADPENTANTANRDNEANQENTTEQRNRHIPDITIAVSSQSQTETPLQNALSNEILWKTAFDIVFEREPKLMADFDKYLSSILDPSDQSEASSDRVVEILADEGRINEVVKKLVDQRKDKQWQLKFISKDAAVRDGVEVLAKLLKSSDAVIKQVAALNPYSSLAWSGVSLFLPLLTNGMAQHEKMVKSFTAVIDIQRLWKSFEDTTLIEPYRKHYIHLAKPISELYSFIIEFQARAICTLSSGQLSRAWQSVSGANDWPAKEQEVTMRNDRCLKNFDILRQQEARLHMNQQWQELAKSTSIQEQILHTLEKGRQDDLETQVFQALSKDASDYEQDKNFNDIRLPETCEWFLSDEKFSNWRDRPESGLLWATAGPGCGKSVLARSLIDEGHLSTSTMTIWAEGSDILVSQNAKTKICYFFFKEGDNRRTSAAQALRAMLHQLFVDDTTKTLIHYAVAKYKIHGKDLANRFGELWKILVECASAPGQGDIICVFDALDECHEKCKELITAINGFLRDQRKDPKKSCNLKLIITSRPYDYLQSFFKVFGDLNPYVHFDGDDKIPMIIEDIDLAIDAKLPEITEGFSESEYKRIEKRLKSMKNRTYLWLQLTFSMIKDSPSDYCLSSDLDSLFSSLPSNVSESYEAILNKRKESKKTELLLQIILAAERPLALREANCALSLALCESSEPSLEELGRNITKGDFKSVVRNLCGLIVTIHNHRLVFIHLTAREFLLASQRSENSWKGKFNLEECHSLLFRVCTRLIILDESTDLDQLDDIPHAEDFFVDYCVRVWSTHYEAQSPSAKRLYQDFTRALCRPNPTPKWVYKPDAFLSRRMLYDNISEIQLISLAGLNSILEDIIDKEKVNINEIHGIFGTVLHAAILGSHINTVRLLLRKGADINAYCPSVGSVVEVAAAYSENDEILTLLLNHSQGLAFTERLLVSVATSHRITAVQTELLLKKHGHRINISEGGLCAVLRVSSEAAAFILERFMAPLHITEEMLINATKSSDPLQTIELLLRYAGDDIQLTTDIIIAVARSNLSLSLMEYLFSVQAHRIQLTEDMVAVIIGSFRDKDAAIVFIDKYAINILLPQQIMTSILQADVRLPGLMKFLLETRSAEIKITEDLIIEVLSTTYSEIDITALRHIIMRNSKKSTTFDPRVDLLELILNKSNSSSLMTTRVILAAERVYTNEIHRYRSWIPDAIRVLLQHREPDLRIVGEVVVALTRICPPDLLQEVLKDPTTKIEPTTELFLAAADNTYNEEVMDLVAEHTKSKIPATSEIFKAVVNNPRTRPIFLIRYIDWIGDDIVNWEDVTMYIISKWGGIEQDPILKTFACYPIVLSGRTWAAILHNWRAPKFVEWCMRHFDRDFILNSITPAVWIQAARDYHTWSGVQMIEDCQPDTVIMNHDIASRAVANSNGNLVYYILTRYLDGVPEAITSYLVDLYNFCSALNRDDVDYIRQVITQGSHVTATDSDGQNALLRAVRFASVDLIRVLLSNGDLEINGVDYKGQSALYIAAERNRPPIVAVLLDAGADPHLIMKSGKSVLQELKQKSWYTTSVKLMEDRSTWF